MLWVWPTFKLDEQSVCYRFNTATVHVFRIAQMRQYVILTTLSL